MLSRSELESKLQEIKPILSERFFVKSIGYFGSYATGDQNENSDVDILVEFSQPMGWEFFTLEDYLEQTLGIAVDLVTPNAIRESMKASILKQVHYI